MAEIVITKTGNSVNIKDVSAPASNTKLDFTATAGTFHLIVSSDAQAPTSDDTITIHHKRKGLIGSFTASEFTTPSGGDVETIRPLLESLMVSPASSSAAPATSKTYAEWEALRSTDALGPYIGQQVIVSDRGDTGLILTVASANAFGLAGTGGFLNSDWQDQGDYSSVFNFTGLAKGTNNGLWNAGLEATMQDGEIVIWNNFLWQVVDFNSFAGTDPYANIAAYIPLPRYVTTITYDNLQNGPFLAGQDLTDNVSGWTGFILDLPAAGTLRVYSTTNIPALGLNEIQVGTTTADVTAIGEWDVIEGMGYIEEWDAIEFDWSNDHIQRRADIRGNDFQMDFASLTEYSYGETLSEMQWGRASTLGNKVKNGLASIMNFGGEFIGNQIQPNGEVFGLSGESTSIFSHNTVMQRASMSNITLGDGSAVGSCIMEIASAMDSMDLSSAGCSIAFTRVLCATEVSNKALDAGVSILSCVIGNPVPETDTVSATIEGKRTEAGFSNFEATIDVSLASTSMRIEYSALAGGPFEVGETLRVFNGVIALFDGTILSDDGTHLAVTRTSAYDYTGTTITQVTGANTGATATIDEQHIIITIPAKDAHCGIIKVQSGNAEEHVLLMDGASPLFDYEIHPAPALALTIVGTPYATALAGSFALPAATLVLDGATGDWAKFRNDGTRNVHIDTVQNL